MKITKREKDILQILFKDRNLSNKEIAWELGIKPETIKMHLGNLNKKLNTKTRFEILEALDGKEF